MKALYILAGIVTGAVAVIGAAWFVIQQMVLQVGQ